VVIGVCGLFYELRCGITLSRRLLAFRSGVFPGAYSDITYPNATIGLFFRKMCVVNVLRRALSPDETKS